MAIDMRLVNLGKGEPRDGIAAQIRILAAHARKTENVELLKAFGWLPEDTDELETIGEELATDRARQAEARDESRMATVAQNAALSNGKLLKRKIDRALRIVFRRAEQLPVSQQAFEAGGPIGRSVPKLLAWFTSVEPHVAKIADKLAMPMGVADPAAAVAKARVDLSTRDTDQEVKLADLPTDTLQVYETKGRAMVKIADLIDIAHNALEENASEAAKFNKDAIVRARKQRKAKVQTPAA